MNAPDTWRCSIQRGLFGWIIATEDEWYYRATEEEAVALRKELRKRSELERKETNP